MDDTGGQPRNVAEVLAYFFSRDTKIGMIQRLVAWSYARMAHEFVKYSVLKNRKEKKCSWVEEETMTSFQLKLYVCVCVNLNEID